MSSPSPPATQAVVSVSLPYATARVTAMAQSPAPLKASPADQKESTP